jgi:SAM-dependent methyltransferase
MHVNHTYALDFVTSRFAGGIFLDYGCGAGETVAAGLARGIRIHGVDGFYEGDPILKRKLAAAGLLGTAVHELNASGGIPFPDSFFDAVLSNMVFEHVSNLGAVLAEIRRVLKPTGELLALFPSVEVIGEGHCGVPFTHRLLNRPKAAYFYLRFARALGLGYFHDGKSQAQWAADFVSWLKKFCVYRTEREILQQFSAAGFSVRGAEPEYAEYRLRQGILAPLAPLTRARRPVTFAIRRLATMVLVATLTAPMPVEGPLLRVSTSA